MLICKCCSGCHVAVLLCYVTTRIHAPCNQRSRGQLVNNVCKLRDIDRLSTEWRNGRTDGHTLWYQLGLILDTSGKWLTFKRYGQWSLELTLRGFNRTVVWFDSFYFPRCQHHNGYSQSVIYLSVHQRTDPGSQRPVFPDGRPSKY